MILENVDHKNILFIDIETVPGCDAFESLPEELQALWLQKSKSWSCGMAVNPFEIRHGPGRLEPIAFIQYKDAWWSIGGRRYSTGLPRAAFAGP